MQIAFASPWPLLCVCVYTGRDTPLHLSVSSFLSFWLPIDRRWFLLSAAAEESQIRRLIGKTEKKSAAASLSLCAPLPPRIDWWPSTHSHTHTRRHTETNLIISQSHASRSGRSLQPTRPPTHLPLGRHSLCVARISNLRHIFRRTHTHTRTHTRGRCRAPATVSHPQRGWRNHANPPTHKAAQWDSLTVT